MTTPNDLISIINTSAMDTKKADLALKELISKKVSDALNLKKIEIAKELFKKKADSKDQ